MRVNARGHSAARLLPASGLLRQPIRRPALKLLRHAAVSIPREVLAPAAIHRHAIGRRGHLRHPLLLALLIDARDLLREPIG
jgi:hypothetical protein